MSLYSPTVDARRPSAPLASSEHVHGPIKGMDEPSPAFTIRGGLLLVAILALAALFAAVL